MLFAAGLLPALLIRGMLIGYSTWYSIRNGYARDPMPSFCGHHAGHEARGMGAGAADHPAGRHLFGGVHAHGIHRDRLSLRLDRGGGGLSHHRPARNADDPEGHGALLSGPLLLITAGASAFSWLLATTGTPSQIASQVLASTDSPMLIMLLFNALLLVAGCFLDSASAIIILAPLMQPIAAQVAR